MSNLDRALQLAQLNLHVFPCREVPGSLPDQVVKAPYTLNGSKDASRLQSTIEAWWSAHPDALIGVATGKSNIIVADIDRKKGKDGYASLDAAGRQLTETFTYDTPNGGRHYVYASTRSGSLSQSTNLDGMQGVDRQSGLSYVVWYGDAPWEAELSAPPEWLTALYGSASIYPDAKPFQGALADWVNDLAGGTPSYFVQGLLADIASTPHIGNGELLNLSYRLAFNAQEQQTGVRQAHDALRARYWETSNETEAGKEREWDRQLRGAIAQAVEAERLGNITPYEPEWTPSAPTALSEALTEARELNAEAAPIKAPGIKVLTFDDLLSIPEPVWWIDGLFKEASLGVIAAEGGIGKTFTMLHAAGCIATGTPFFGREVKQGKVLYVAAEGIEEFAKRIQAMADYHRMDLSVLSENMRFIESGVMLTDNASMDEFASILREDGYDFIVLDTLSQLAAVQSENDAAQLAEVFRVARRLRGLHPGSTIITVHHAGKATGKYRGSSAIRDNVDTLVAVLGSSSGFALSTMYDDSGKQRSAQPEKIEGFQLISHLDSAVLALTGARAELPAHPDWIKIRDLLADGTPRTMQQIADDTDIPRKTVERVTKRARESDAMPVDHKEGNKAFYTLLPLPEASPSDW